MAGAVARDTRQRVQVLLLGLALWAFALLVPCLHLRASGDSPVDRLAAIVLLLLPLSALVGGVLAGSASWLLAVVPALFLPALLEDPRLVGDRVYGFGAFVVTAGALGAYLVAAARMGGHAPERGTRGRFRWGGGALRSWLVAGGLAGLLALFLWWAAFDPSLRWETSMDGAQARHDTGTLPTLVVIACWLSIVLGVVIPLVLRPRGTDGLRSGAPAGQGVADGR